jgi:anti-sigma factor RsiW
MCTEGNKEALIGYLYGELAPDERRVFESHLKACAPCREEVSGLRAAREDLLAWAPPECRDLPSSWTAVPAGLAPASRLRAWMPAFGLAAAAMLVMAASASMAQLEIRYGRDGLVVRAGGAAPAAEPAALAARAPAPDPSYITAGDLQALEARLRQSFSASAAPSVQTAGLSSDNPRLTPAMRRLIEESEERIRQEMASRFLDIVTDFEEHRRTDLLRVQQVVGQLQRSTGADIAQQRDMLNRLMLVSQTQGQQPR